MSRQITLGNIKVRSLACFEVAFKKYMTELEKKRVTPLPVFSREVNPTHKIGEITRANKTLARLLFQPENGAKTPEIDEKGRILNGFARLEGDEDYLKNGITSAVNPIDHNRLDAYYTGEATTEILQGLGFNCEDYEVNQNCELEYFGTREVEDSLVGNF